MALPTITIDDFKGWANVVANQFKESLLDEYVVTFRERYLRRIVGDAVYSDISTQTRQKWDDLIEGVDYVDSAGVRRRYPGLKTSLILFIYFEFIRDNFTSTQSGKVKPNAENSVKASGLEVVDLSRSRYNQGALLIKHSTLPFLEANDLFQDTVVSSLDNADNTYTLGVSTTKYVETGDKVNVGGTKYPVISVVQNVSITIDAGQTGLDFTSDTAEWRPYEDVIFCPIDFCGI